MQLTKRIILSVGLCIAATGVFAQTANDIINKNIDAMGGREKLMKLTSVYEEMTTSVMGQDITGKVWIVNDKGMRTEMTVMEKKIVTVMTKDTGWMINPMMGSDAPQPLPMEQVKQSAARMDLRGQFLNYAKNGYTATLLGKEPVDGKDAYKIKLSKGSENFTFYIDASTYLITKIETVVSAAGQSVNTEVGMTDYKKTPEGYSFPYTTNINVSSGMKITSTITKLVVNPTVDPTVFTKP